MSETKKPLRLFVDPVWRRGSASLSPLMFPFWGNPITESALFSKEMFDAHPFDTAYYTLVERIEEANMVFPPYQHIWLVQNDPALLTECDRRAQEARLPLLIDGFRDVELPVVQKNAYVLRIGGYRFLSEKNRVQIPIAADDLLERCARGVFTPRTKRMNERPVVGFAGWAQLTAMQTVRTIAKEIPQRIHSLLDSRYRAMKKGVLWRAQALDVLGSSDKVNLNVIRRPSFSGNAKTASADMRALRQEFVELVLASDYGLDVRGDTNESTRLYEILSLGRIPVILDTERNLPFRDVVRYEDFALIVDFRDIRRLPELIAEFHQSLTSEMFEEMQRKAREAFVQNFRIDALMLHIVRILRQYGAINS